MTNKEKEVTKKLLTSKQLQKKTVKNLINEFFLPLDSSDSKKNLAKLQPNARLMENQSLYSLKVELAGFERGSFKIQVSKNKLSIYAEKVTEVTEETEGQKLHISEINYGMFSKSYSFSSPIDPERSSARFVDGLLTVLMPKLIIIEKNYFLKVE